MADNKDTKENINNPEKKYPAGEQAVHFGQEAEKKVEKKEVSPDDKKVSAELRREIEMMSLDDNLKKIAEQKANKISFMADDDKLKNLLQIAKIKGVVFAVKVAKSMNDPFLLDALHDMLAQEGYYKDFTK